MDRKKKDQEQEKNLKIITKSNEFFNLTNFLVSKIKSPYVEVKYTIKNNDSVEKILKKFNIKSEDIKNISLELKKNNLLISTQVGNSL